MPEYLFSEWKDSPVLHLHVYQLHVRERAAEPRPSRHRQLLVGLLNLGEFGVWFHRTRRGQRVMVPDDVVRFVYYC